MVYYGVMQNSFRKIFTYRTSVIVENLESIVFVFAQIALWNYIYMGDQEKIKYMTVYVILARLITILYSHEIVDIIGERIRSGDIAFSLIRPVYWPIYFIFESLGLMLARFAIQAPLLCIIFFPSLLFMKLNLYVILAFIVFCLLSLVFINMFMLLEGFLTFILLESWAIVYAGERLILIFSGALIPLSLFPSWLNSILSATPFPYLYSMPIRILLDNLPFSEIIQGALILIVWIIIMTGICLVVYNRMLSKVSIQGG